MSLAAQQTPLRSQGARGTCSAFGSVAALEAAYKRQGYGDVDLSEEFLAYAGKLMWLNVMWTRVAQQPAYMPENFHAATTGSTGTFLVQMLAAGFATPTEADLPYREGYGGQMEGYEDLAHPWWTMAWNVDLWNLDPRRLPRALLSAPAWHRVRDYRWIYLGRAEGDPTYAERFEEVLASGREIVWDVAVRSGAAQDRDPIWRHDPARPPHEAHAMLVVGYDRSDPDPRQHHFLVKNSWGPTQHPDGLTRVAYDYLRYGLGALYVESVEPPSGWPAVGFVGRWHLSLDGQPAVLAWNRVPGVVQLGLDQTRALQRSEPQMLDRRVGNLYLAATPQPVLRVNGTVHDGRSASVWFDPATPRPRYDALAGRRMDLRLLGPARDACVGTFADGEGRRARCYGALAGRLGREAAPGEATALAGAWRLWAGEGEGRLDLGDGSTGTGRLELAAYGLSRRVEARPAVDDPRVLVVFTELPRGGTLSLRLSPLSREAGVLVGEAYASDPAGGAPRELGALAVRLP
ncbi:MAG: C1 family peptidase [Planctomycetia bacterium]